MHYQEEIERIAKALEGIKDILEVIYLDIVKPENEESEEEEE